MIEGCDRQPASVRRPRGLGFGTAFGKWWELSVMEKNEGAGFSLGVVRTAGRREQTCDSHQSLKGKG
ncbi:hypothetical protein TIFTF001_023649 [Ficus carica]|uniref:Uncharacterized protein n=1 Tax=Ficus carica TaxID=3494 RepID=A0AA88B068_FICCA|nr:hypothetical protein TIFTF001_023649 [Ficus carica]